LDGVQYLQKVTNICTVIYSHVRNNTYIIDVVFIYLDKVHSVCNYRWRTGSMAYRPGFSSGWGTRGRGQCTGEGREGEGERGREARGDEVLILQTGKNLGSRRKFSTEHCQQHNRALQAAQQSIASTSTGHCQQQ
jgi:hypothetical protein